MTVLSFVPAAITTVIAVIGLLVLHYVVGDSPARRLARQLGQLGWTIVAVVLLIIMLPLGATLRGQILGLLGIVLSGAVALSSTTLLGNMLAGLMLRATRTFRLGDFIEVGGLHGRVSARGLVQVEIQTSDRSLQTLPNLKLVTEAVKVIPAEGAIIHADVSLGYDVPRPEVERCLQQAAEDAGLASPFVFVMALGDFSVVYRVFGQIEDVGTLLTSRARLLASVMDALHRDGVEIVSPNFMNTRVVQDQTFVPAQVQADATAASTLHAVEELIFDKAEQAEGVHELEQALDQAKQALDALKDPSSGETPEAERARLQDQVSTLEERLESAKEALQTS